MITLTILSTQELAQLDGALTLLDAVLETLAAHGAIDERDGVDLLELYSACGAELEFREAVYG